MNEPLLIVSFCHSGVSSCTALIEDNLMISVFDKLKKSDRSLEKVLQMPKVTPNNIISSETATIAGSPAQKIVYTTQSFGPQSKSIKFIFVKDDKAFEILYTPLGQNATEQSSIVSSDAQKIIDSFQFIT